MLNAVNSNEFAIYTQELREVKDEYTRIKSISDRAKVAKFLNRALADRELIISWSEDDKMFSTVATLNTRGYDNCAPLPEIPEEFDDINGNKKPAQKHIHFYSKPQMIPVLLEIDKVEVVIARREGLDEMFLRND